MNYEINVIFLIKPFFYLTKKSRQKFKCFENEKRFPKPNEKKFTFRFDHQAERKTFAL